MTCFRVELGTVKDGVEEWSFFGGVGIETDGNGGVIMNMVKVGSVGLALLAFLWIGSSVAAQTIDFQVLECSGAGGLDVGEVYEEDGFRFTKGPGEPHVYKRFCTGAPRYPGSTALYNNTANGQIILAKIDGGAFTVTEIKAVALNGPAAVPINFVGTKSGGGEVRHGVVTDGRGPSGGLETFVFPPDFNDVVKLEWVQESGFHQFDDVVLEAGGGCGEKAKLKAKCKKGGTKVKGKLKKANPNVAVTFRLDGGQERPGQTDNKGKAKASWKHQDPGGHTVTVCDLETRC